MGISYVDLTNNPAITLAGLPEAGGPLNQDDFTYTIDVDMIAAQHGQTSIDHVDPSTIITLTGDWHRADDTDLDGFDPTWNGDYVAAQIPNPAGGLYFGNLSVDQTSGNMTWSFTVADLQAYAGQNYDVYFVGKYADQQSDSDLLKLVITCFITGTMIATPAGEAAIETLSIGDMISTADGRSVPVKWVGRKTIASHVMLPAKALPVCISAGAFGNGLPHRDLYLSADHGMIVDGMVVNAGALVNDATIRFVDLADMPAEFTYWHIETEAHDEILANGAPAETFVDYIGRKAFDNHQEYLDLYGCERIIPEMKRLRISAQRQLPESTAARLGITSFARKVEDDFAGLMQRLAA